MRPAPRRRLHTAAEILTSNMEQKWGSGMQDISVDKAELLAILEANREKHAKVYKEARAGYIKARQAECLEWMTLLDEGKIAPRATLLDRPEKHLDDYDSIISMLKMDRGTTFRMDENTYRQLVMDQWHWRQRTLARFSTYAAASTTANYGAQDSDDDDF